MPRDFPQEVSVEILDPGSASRERIAGVMRDAQNDTVIVLNDAHLPESEECTSLSPLVEQIRGWIAECSSPHRIVVADPVPFYRGGHNAIHAADPFVVRRQREGVPPSDLEVRARLRKIAEERTDLVRTLAIVPDPRSTPKSPRLLSVQHHLNGTRLSESFDCLTLRELLALNDRKLALHEVLHEQGILHLDMKPGNVLVQDDGLVVMDDDLARAPGKVLSPKRLGTKPLPRELVPPDDYPLAERRMEGRTDDYRTFQILQEILVLDRDEEDPGDIGELWGFHTDFQRAIFRIYVACRDPYPGRRPTAAEIRSALACFQSCLSPTEWEREEFFYAASRKLKRALTDGTSVAEIQQLIDEYERLGSGAAEDPFFFTEQIAKLQLLCGDRILEENPEAREAACGHYEKATHKYLQALDAAPLYGYEYGRAAFYLSKLAENRAAQSPEGDANDLEHESLAWISVSALVVIPDEKIEMLHRACFLGGERLPAKELYEWLLEDVSKRVEVGEASDWTPESIRSRVSASHLDVLEWWDKLEEDHRSAVPGDAPVTLHATKLRLLTLLRVYLRTLSQGMPHGGASSRALLVRALSIADLLVLLDESPPADFWALRGGIFMQLRDLEVKEGNRLDLATPDRRFFCAQECFETAYEKSPQTDLVARAYAGFLEHTGEHQRAMAVMEKVPPLVRSSGFLCRLADMYPQDSHEADECLAQAYLRDSSNDEANQRIVTAEFQRDVPDFHRIAHHVEKVFCHDYGRPRRAGDAILEEGLLSLLERNPSPKLDQVGAKRLYDLWHQWDRTGSAKYVFLTLASEMHWEDFVTRIRLDIDDQPIVEFLDALHEKSSFSEAAELAAASLPGIVPGLLSCTVCSKESADHGESVNIRGTEPPMVLSFEMKKSDDHGDGHRRPLALQHTTAHLLGKVALNERHTSLRERHASLRKDIEAAGEAQRELLPRDGDGCIGEWRAGTERVGGDGYDWVKISPYQRFFCIYDVSGHGASCIPLQVRFAAAVKHAVREAQKHCSTNLQEIASSIIAEFPDLDGRFITAIVGIRNDETGEVQMVNFGHPPPMLRNGAHVEKCSPGDDSMLPVGLPREDHKLLPIHHVKLNTGDELLLYTDGIIEAGSSREGLLGIDGLRDFISGHGNLPVDALKDRIFEHVEALGKEDDCSLVVVGPRSYTRADATVSGPPPKSTQ